MTAFAFVFPGQGSQAPGMGKDFYREFVLARQVFEEASDALRLDLAKLCFEGSDQELQLTANTQPAVLTVSAAAWKVLHAETGLHPVVAAGHSLGEYTALLAAGALDLDSAVVAVRKRGQFMQDAVPAGEGAMAAVMGLDAESVTKVCEEAAQGEVVRPANFNAPDQIAISGAAAAVGRASALAKERGAKRVIPLKVSAPFHCELMQGAAERMAEVLQGIAWQKLSCPVISNLEAKPYPGPEAAAELLQKQITSPVRWTESVQAMAEMAAEVFLELGPGKVLSGLIRRIRPEAKTLNLSAPKDLKAVQEIL
jgi:[acyl-carrier-protein] S-malonyltransferase